MVDAQVVAFTGIVALLTITPGADTMLVLRSVVAHRRRAGLWTTFGVCCGLFVHATLSALGLSLILVRSATAFEVVKIAGAGYLLFLGSQSLWRGLRSEHSQLVGAASTGTPTQQRPWRSFADGLFTNVLNP